METRSSRFNQVFLGVLAILYVITLGGFTYLNWMAEGDSHELWMHLLNALILSIPLALFYGSIYILICAWQAQRRSGGMTPRQAKIIHLAPRIAAMLIIFFVSLFSLDAFELEGTLLQKVGGFIIHSVPSIAMIILLVFAWRWPVVGFVAFLLGSLFFMRFVVFNGSLLHFLLFSGPLLLIAMMFYADWRWNRPKIAAPKAAGA